MNVIVVGPNGRPSITELLKTFKFDSEVRMYSYITMRRTGTRRWFYKSSNAPLNKRSLVSEPTFGPDDKVIFWGSRVEIRTDGALVYNHPYKINNASNKKVARSLFDKKDVPAPMVIDIKELSGASYPVIIRKSHHRAGIGFHVAKSEFEAKNILRRLGTDDFYISEFYPKTAEYRVHCASGKALLVKQKPTPSDKSIIAWNFHQNELPWTNIERKAFDLTMCQVALQAIEALELDFGAADIMSKPSAKGFPEHVVVEVNTAPSYTPYLIEKYGAYFNKLFNTKDKLEPWDWKTFKKGESLAWKNSQLKEKK